MMNSISFEQVTPHVFLQRENLQSDVWQQPNLRFEKGKFYLVEAQSGLGKSTFCSYILGYRQDYEGVVKFDETDISLLSTADWVNVRQRNVSQLFQELRLFPELTALENVMLKNQLTHFKTETEIRAWFEQLGIADKINTRVGKMSFGQRQRVATLRALVQPFDFLLADEPISHLDDFNADTLGELMAAEAKAQGAALIVTSIGKHPNLQYDKILKL